MKFITKASKQKYHDTRCVILLLFAQSYHIWHHGKWFLLSFSCRGDWPICYRSYTVALRKTSQWFRHSISSHHLRIKSKSQQLNNKWKGIQSLLLVKVQELITSMLMHRIEAVKAILPFKPAHKLAAFQFICMTKLIFQSFLSIFT